MKLEKSRKWRKRRLERRSWRRMSMITLIYMLTLESHWYLALYLCCWWIRLAALTCTLQKVCIIGWGWLQTTVLFLDIKMTCYCSLDPEAARAASSKITTTLGLVVHAAGEWHFLGNCMALVTFNRKTCTVLWPINKIYFPLNSSWWRCSWSCSFYFSDQCSADRVCRHHVAQGTSVIMFLICCVSCLRVL